MLTIPSAIIKDADNSEISITHGRIGKWNEYVEFQTHDSKTRYVAQKSRGDIDVWFVFKIKKGKRGAVETLYMSKHFDEAVSYAYSACNLYL